MYEGLVRSHSKLCDLNEHLDGLPSTESLLSGIQARDQVPQRAYLYLRTTHNKPRPQGTFISPQIPIRSGTHGHVLTSSYELLNAPWVNKLQFLPRLRRFFLIFNQIFLASVMLNVRPLDPTPFTSFTTF